MEREDVFKASKENLPKNISLETKDVSLNPKRSLKKTAIIQPLSLLEDFPSHQKGILQNICGMVDRRRIFESPKKKALPQMVLGNGVKESPHQ